MASAWSGQTALCQLPTGPDEKNERGQTTLESYAPLDCLRATRRGDAETKKTGIGIAVYKVASTGKIQPRRLAISSDNRTILISSTKIQSKFKSVKKIFNYSSSQTNGGMAARRIDISSIDSIQRGQQAGKFGLAKERASTHPEEGLVEKCVESLSLSIVYRVPVSSTSQSAFDLSFASVNDASLGSSTLESLDLTVPSKEDYQTLIETLEELLNLYKAHRSNVHRDVLLLQHYWIDMGKTFEKPISASEWINICADGLGVPMQKSQLQSLYEKHCEKIGAEAGLKLHQAVGLLSIVRERAMANTAMSVGHGDPDPCNRVWQQIKSADADNIDVGGNEAITAEQFLRFLQDEQKDVSTTMNEVRDLFSRLNAVAEEEEEKRPSIPNDRMTKSTFVHFLMSDANDIFDPSSGNVGRNDMSKPLSSYWINTSHKTYMAGNSTSNRDVVQAYLAALRRGCRCLELDLWDGQGIHHGSPVIGRGNTSHVGEDKSEISILDSVPLEHVLRIVRSFLQSQPQSYPIILSLENHCSIPYQNKIDWQFKDILGDDNMLYIPPDSLHTLKALPSPESLRGKVVIKSKRPTHDGKSETVVNDDFDDENDFDPRLPAPSHAVEIDDGEEEDGIVIGFRSVGSIVSDSPHEVERTPQELLEVAEKEANDAKNAAESAKKRAFDLEVEVNKAEKHVNELASKIGLTYQDLERQRCQLGAAEEPQDRHGNGLPSLQQSQKFAVPETHPTNDDGTTGTFSPVSGSGSSDTHPSQDFSANLGTLSLESGGTELGASTLGSAGSEPRGWLDNLGRDLFPPVYSSDTFSSQRTGSTGYIERTDEPKSAKKEVTEMEMKAEPAMTTKKSSPANTDEDGGVEVQDFFFESVAQAEETSVKADEEAAKASEAAASALSEFQQVSQALAAVEESIYSGVEKKRDLAMAADRAAAEARANREHAETAKQRVVTVQQLRENCSNQAKSAETVAATAATEAEISEQRAVEAEKRAERAQAIAKRNREAADAETKNEEDLGKEALGFQTKYEEATAIYRSAKEVSERAAGKLGQIEAEVKRLEESPDFIKEYSKATEDHPEDEEIVVLPGSMLAKHKAKMVEMKSYLDDVRRTSTEKASAEKSRRRCRHMLEQIHHKIKEQGKVASVARKQADKSTSLADQLAEYAEEEREAANMRRIALDKAVACVEKSSAHGSSVDAQLVEAERAAAEAVELAAKSRIFAEKLAKEATERTYEDPVEEKEKLEKLKAEKEKAAIALDAATAVKKKADDVAADARRRMETNRELFDKAKQDSAEEINRVKADETIKENVTAAHCKAVVLRQQAEEAKKEAINAVSHAADKEAAAKHAKRYRDKKARVKPISQSLEQSTLIHSTKFLNLEKSSKLPFWYMHSISEGEMLHMVGQGALWTKQWKAFNKKNITRVFPFPSMHMHLSSSSGNLNPILPWMIGCQMVSMNCHACDDFSFLNDGRFRENGSCGYVLKPEQLAEAEEIAQAGEDCPDDEIQIDVPRKLNVKVLSGCNLPIPESGVRGAISTRVRVALFDGVSVGESDSVHVTETVKSNRISPVWNEESGASFVASKPSVAVVLISVWNVRDGEDVDDFVAAAAVPVSSIRQGYRSVQLFDSNHSRRGAYGFASLLVKVSTERSNTEQ